MRIVLIGAGSLATNLGRALKEAGENIIQVYSRTEESASTLAARLDCPYTCSLETVSLEAELYIVSVKDSVLSDVLVSLSTPERADALFVHTAGSMPLSVFDRAGIGRCGVFYPMQTFSKLRPVDFVHLPVFIESKRQEDLPLLRDLSAELSADVYEMSSEKRRYLHLAAVFACNFANHCYARAGQILREQGIPFDVMLPLIDETAAKVHDMLPREAQTGPAVRYDRNVMEHHLELLNENTDVAEEYELLSRGIHALQHSGDTD